MLRPNAPSDSCQPKSRCAVCFKGYHLMQLSLKCTKNCGTFFYRRQQVVRFLSLTLKIIKVHRFLFCKGVEFFSRLKQWRLFPIFHLHRQWNNFKQWNSEKKRQGALIKNHFLNLKQDICLIRVTVKLTHHFRSKKFKFNKKNWWTRCFDLKIEIRNLTLMEVSLKKKRVANIFFVF